MVKFTFNTFGFAFEKGVHQLVGTFRLTSQALEANRNQTQAELDAVEADMAAGRPVPGEWDEDGCPLWTQDQVLRLQVEDSADALQALRRSFIIALYHHWERWMGRQFGTDDAKHQSLVTQAEIRGLAIHPKLEAVRLLANLFKHSNRIWGEKLLTSWPGIMPSHFTKETQADWYAAARLEDETVLAVAEIVAASGPRSNRTYQDATPA